MSSRTIFSLLLIAVFAAIAHAADDASAVPQPVQGILRTHCYDCHGEKKSKGKIRLDTLSALEQKARL